MPIKIVTQWQFYTHSLYPVSQNRKIMLKTETLLLLSSVGAYMNVHFILKIPPLNPVHQKEAVMSCF